MTAGGPIDASAQTGNLFIIATDRADKITTGQGDDSIEGGGGNDRIYFDDDDTATPTGADTFYYSFERHEDGYSGLDGRDYIKDFKTGEDKLVLRGDGISFDSTADFLTALSDNGVTASSIVSKTDTDKLRGVLIDFSVADSAPNGTCFYVGIVIFFDEEIADTGFGTLATAKGGLREIDDISVLGTVLGTDGITYADRVITGAAGGQTVEGANLSNIIKPGSGDDTVKGGGGDDILLASQGDDSYEGGAGYDIVTYAANTGAITIDMTDKENSTMKDSFVDIEGIIGTRFDDVIVGATNAVLRLFGGAGNDKITAGSLGSRLYGDAGGDELTLGAGNDVVDFTSVTDFADISADIITDFTSGTDSIKLSEGLLGDDGVITAALETLNGETGLSLSATITEGGVEKTVNFAFLEGVSELSVDDFEGDYIPTIDVI